MEEWSARWSAAVTSIGLRFAATIEEAQAALDVWNEVPNAIRERNNRARLGFPVCSETSMPSKAKLRTLREPLPQISRRCQQMQR